MFDRMFNRNLMEMIGQKIGKFDHVIGKVDQIVIYVNETKSTRVKENDKGLRKTKENKCSCTRTLCSCYHYHSLFHIDVSR